MTVPLAAPQVVCSSALSLKWNSNLGNTKTQKEYQMDHLKEVKKLWIESYRNNEEQETVTSNQNDSDPRVFC